MRVRVALGAAAAVVLAGLALVLSHRAVGGAGSDHAPEFAFVATIANQRTLCQDQVLLPNDAASASVLIGSYGAPVPPLHVWFSDSRGLLAQGRLSGAHEGYVTVPLSYPHRHAVRAGRVCMTVAGTRTIVVGGINQPLPARVGSVAAGGRIGIFYYRRGRESWWHFLPTLSERMGEGKSPWFGSWTLPVLAALMLAIWAAAFRLMGREFDRSGGPA